MTIPGERVDGIRARAEGWMGFLPRLALQSAARANRRRHATRHLTRLLTLYALDAFGVLVAMTVMMMISPREGWGHVVRWNDPAVGALSVFAQNVVAMCAGLFVMNAYHEGDAVQDAGRVVPGVALGLLVLHWPMIWHDGMSLFTSYLPSVAVYGLSVWFIRRVSDWTVHSLWSQMAEPSRALFVGSPEEIESEIRRSPMKGPHALIPVARIDLTGSGDVDDIASRLESLISKHDVDTTLLCSQFDDDALGKIVGTSEAAGCRVISLSRTYSLAKQRPRMTTYDRTPVVELTRPGIRGRDLVLKRAFDAVVASLLLLALSPLLIVVALLVKRSSPGPGVLSAGARRLCWPSISHLQVPDDVQ